MDSYLRCYLFLLCSVLALPAAAGPYVSVGMGVGNAAIEVDTFNRRGDQTFASSQNETTLALALRLGWAWERQRLGLTGRMLPYDNAVLSLVGVSYERQFGHGSLQPFVGATVGVAGFTWLDDTSVEGFPDPALVRGEYVFDAAVGLRVGGRQRLTDRLSLEVGLKGVATDLETDIGIKHPTANGPVNGGRLSHSVRGFLIYELGFSYRF